MSEPGWREFFAADGVDDWVVLHGVFKVGSMGEAAQLAQAIVEIDGFEGSGAATKAPPEPAEPRADPEVHS